MLSEQISSIVWDVTGIEKLKNETSHSSQRSTMYNLSETFGRPFSILWLLPTPVRYHGSTWLELLPQETEV